MEHSHGVVFDLMSYRWRRRASPLARLGPGRRTTAAASRAASDVGTAVLPCLIGMADRPPEALDEGLAFGVESGERLAAVHPLAVAHVHKVSGQCGCTHRKPRAARTKTAGGQKVLSLQTVPTHEAPPTPGAVPASRVLASMPRCAAPQRKKLGSEAQGSRLLGAPRTQHCAATSPAPPSPMDGLHSTGPGRSYSH